MSVVLSHSYKITKITSTGRFRNKYKKLTEDIKKHVETALADLLKSPLPSYLRFEKLKGIKNPSIYTIHITPNHSHKISFELNGLEVTLRNIGTHKEIDRSP